METELEKFLEHHGVRGMKWGQRSKRRGGIAGAGLVGAGVGAALISPRFRSFMGPRLKTPLSILVVGAGAFAASKAAKSLIDANASMKVSDIP